MKRLMIAVLFAVGCTQYIRKDFGEDKPTPSVLKKKKIVMMGMTPFKSETGTAVNPYSDDPDFLKMLLFIGKAGETANTESRFNFSTYHSSGRYGGGRWRSWKRVPDSQNSLIKSEDYGTSLENVKFGDADARISSRDLAAFLAVYYQYYGYYAFPDMKKIAFFPKDENGKKQLNYSLQARSSDAHFWVIAMPSASTKGFPSDNSISFIDRFSIASNMTLSLLTLGLVPLNIEHHMFFYYTVFDRRFRKIGSGQLFFRKDTYRSLLQWGKNDAELKDPNSALLFEAERRQFTQELARILEKERP